MLISCIHHQTVKSTNYIYCYPVIHQNTNFPLLYKEHGTFLKPNLNQMDVKLDTKEKFTVITPNEQSIPANMTVELKELLLSFLQKDIPHLVFNMQKVENIDEPAGTMIAEIQQQFYEQNASFVICNVGGKVEKIFEAGGLLNIMNITPTESEAWDMVQMEEIERELLGDGE